MVILTLLVEEGTMVGIITDNDLLMGIFTLIVKKKKAYVLSS